MKVVICDDDKKFVDQIVGYFNKFDEEYKEEFLIYRFYDAENMFECCKNHTDIAIVVLDIVFKHSNGIEVAERIRSINSKVRIIFISSFQKYAVQGYGVYADGYLLKPFNYSQFERELKRTISKMQSEQKIFFAENTDQGKLVIEVDNIRFIETCGRKTKIHTKEGEFASYQKMREYEKKLNDKRFYRCHAAYIVNMQYIRKIDDSTVVLKDGSEISISKNRKKDFMKEFTKYVSALINL